VLSCGGAARAYLPIYYLLVELYLRGTCKQAFLFFKIFYFAFLACGGTAGVMKRIF